MTTPPLTALHAIIGGNLHPDSIVVGSYIVTCSIGGVVRVNGRPVGSWRDEPGALAAAFWAATRVGAA